MKSLSGCLLCHLGKRPGGIIVQIDIVSQLKVGHHSGLFEVFSDGWLPRVTFLNLIERQPNAFNAFTSKGKISQLSLSIN